MLFITQANLFPALNRIKRDRAPKYITFVPSDEI